MTTKELYDKIEKYLSSDSHLPIIVDLPSAHELSEFKMHFNVGSNQFLEAYSFAAKDNLPNISRLLDAITHQANTTFLTGISVALKLLGVSETKQFFGKFLSLDTMGKLVLVTTRCADYLSFTDPRIKASNRVLIVSLDELVPTPSILFVSKKLKESLSSSVDGLHKLVAAYETFPGDELTVVTSKTKGDFPDTLIPIREYNSSYDVLSRSIPELNGAEFQWGDEKQWEYLHRALKNRNSWDDYLMREFGGLHNLPNCFNMYASYSPSSRWGHFLALKVCGAKGNEYLSYVISNTNRYADFVPNLYNLILDFDVTSKRFDSLYRERRNILKYLPEEYLAGEFCKLVGGKGENALYYLTDSTDVERRMLLSTIAQYRGTFTIDKLQKAVEVVSPNLYAYLKKVNIKTDWFTRYFELYKYSKLTNFISEEMLAMVDEQAIKREYNKYFVPRATVVSKLSKENAIVYFVDAMGVEYMGYLQEQLYKRNLIGNIQYGRCNLPSITCMNKEFVTDFQNANVVVRGVKSIDEIKHDGVMTFDYTSEKLPIHLFAELAEIDNILKNVETDLASGNYKHVYLISDHGASRLAVINEHENKWEVSEKGQHSGRCCPKSEISDKPDQATEENDFWCLANYDRFRGGRKANVEVHGGATLEEVIVPIVDITQPSADLKCWIDKDSKTVTASFKKNALVRLYISEDFDDVKALVDGKFYDVQKTDFKYYYSVEMPDVKKSGTHTMDVYVNNSIIAQGLTFDVKKEGANERKFF